MKLKYIMDSRGNFVIFSATITHSTVRSQDLGKIVGAGFCNIAPERGYDTGKVNVHCWGESVSLGIQSREEDEKIINDSLYNNY